VVEAIVGAAYLSNADEGAVEATKVLRIPIPFIDRWTFLSENALAEYSEMPSVLPRGSLEAVETLVGIKLDNPCFLVHALVSHSCLLQFTKALNNKLKSCGGKGSQYKSAGFQRLEFLGDAVLDLRARIMLHASSILNRLMFFSGCQTYLLSRKEPAGGTYELA
jgi:hypothetical protein